MFVPVYTVGWYIQFKATMANEIAQCSVYDVSVLCQFKYDTSLSNFQYILPDIISSIMAPSRSALAVTCNININMTSHTCTYTNGT